ncbi:MAG: Gfo/Idh/MocA family oxidoreductase [Bacteroidota bacterium]|nr:Gfo/Idh/MocA family oxidoreductase [Bacteroidota bacterium]
MSKIKFVIIGFGHIGKRHATIANDYPGAEVVAVVDLNKDVVKHELFPKGAQFFESIEAFMGAKVAADIVTIATPNGFHCPYAIKMLDVGYHVVIEKPMGLSKAECEQVIFKSLQVSKQVFVVKQNRYSPPSKWMKEIVGNKTIGEVLMVQVNCYWNRDERYYKKRDPDSYRERNEILRQAQDDREMRVDIDKKTHTSYLIPHNSSDWKGTLDLDGGTLFTQFSHFVDIMYWVFGDVKNIKATFADFNHAELTEFEDSGVINFEFVNGGLGCINFSTSVWDTNMESSITVVGTKGSFKVGGQYMNEVVYCHIKDYEMPVLPPTNAPNDYGPFKGSAANHHFVIENVVNTLNGRDTITANALEGLKVVDIIERIYEQRDLAKLKK